MREREKIEKDFREKLLDREREREREDASDRAT